MEKDLIEVQEYKGHKIAIMPDDDAQSPNDWGNTDLFLVAFGRSFAVEREGYSEGLCQSIMNAGKYEDDSINYEAKEMIKKYHFFVVEAYIHSGISLSLANEGKFPDRQWDVSGGIGMVFVEKKYWKTKAKAREAARSLLEEWNVYNNGEVYGYNILNVGSVWGFHGSDFEKSGLLENARGEIDAYEDERKKKHESKLKAQIKAHAPLDRRAII